jgi:YgiT-type zinc finger domain-containing protein
MPYRTDLEFTHDGITIKPVKGFKCEKCGEVEFESNEAKRIEMLVQEARNKK